MTVLLGAGVPDPRRVVAEAVTIRLPSGLNAAEQTRAVCPWREAMSLPESASRPAPCQSREAVTTRFPSGLNAAGAR